MATAPDPDLIGIQEAAKILNVSESTARRMADRGDFSAVKTALGRLADREDVERAAKERKRKGRPPRKPEDQ